MPFVAPDEPDDFLAALPFPEAQTALTSPPVAGSTRSATCGWHGTFTDPNRGAYAVVAPDGPLADLLGERIRVRSGARAVVATVTAERDIPEDLSLARRAFLELALLSTEELRVSVEVLA